MEGAFAVATRHSRHVAGPLRPLRSLRPWIDNGRRSYVCHATNKLPTKQVLPAVTRYGVPQEERRPSP